MNRIKGILLGAAMVCGLTVTAQTEVPWDFYIYNFGGLQTDVVSVNRSVNLANTAGYDGMALNIPSSKIVEFENYLGKAANKDDFDIHSAFYVMYDKQGDFKTNWKPIVDALVSTDVRLWIMSGGGSPDVSEAELLSNMEDIIRYANIKNVPVLLYPHSGQMIDHAEQAIDVINRLPNDLEVELALILCHEFRYGNSSRLEEMIYDLRDYIGDVVISGSDTIIDNSHFPTYQQGDTRMIQQSKTEFVTATLQPLGQGEYDLKRVLTVLRAIGYVGEIGYINHRFDASNGWDMTTDDYLEQSVDTYNEWMDEVFSPLMSLEAETTSTEALYPNPASSFAVLQLDASWEAEKVLVSSQTGEVVSEYVVTSSATGLRLGTETLAGGLYYVTVHGAGVSRVMKLMVD